MKKFVLVIALFLLATAGVYNAVQRHRQVKEKCCREWEPVMKKERTGMIECTPRKTSPRQLFPVSGLISAGL